MSVERFLLIVDPLGGHPRLTTRIAKHALITLWTMGISLAVIPSQYWYFLKLALIEKYSTFYYSSYTLEKFNPFLWNE